MNTVECVVFLVAVVIISIEPQPTVLIGFPKGRVVVARATERFSCCLCGVPLTLALLALNATVARVIALTTLAAVVLVQFAAVIGGCQKVCPVVELVAPRLILARHVVVSLHETLHSLPQVGICWSP